MSFSLMKVIPQQCVAIGDDGKNRSSHLFDESLETRWSYKGGFAYNLIKLKELTPIDSITFHWYMKKKEKRVYRFGVFTSPDDISLAGSDFESIQKEIQELYNNTNTVKTSNENGSDSTIVQLEGKRVRTIIVVYTHSSSKKSWFSVKEIQIMGRTSLAGSECPDGQKWDPILGGCKEIMEDTDEDEVDGNGVLYWRDDVGSYISENTTFSRNFRTDGSMRMDVEKKDMGGKWRPDKEVVVFLKVGGKNPKEEVSAKLDGGPHNDREPELGRCYDIGVSFDTKRLRLRVEDKHPHMIPYEEIDISGLNLPSLVGRWFGFCFTDRRVLREADKKMLGRILNVRLNPNPFDFNRNVLNDHWIDIGAFIDKGQYKLPIIEGPVDPDKYTDTIRVDGQDAATFLFRYFRYCQIEPIIAQDKEDMERIFSEVREEFEEDAPEPTNPAGIEADIPKQIFISKEGDVVKLSANLQPNPIINLVQWRQSSGTTVPIDIEMLNSGEVIFPYKKEYGTTEWTFTVYAQGGVAVFERTIKIIDTIDQTGDYINPKYPDAKEGFQYQVERDYKLESNETFFSGKSYKNSEVTFVMNVAKQASAFPYAFNIRNPNERYTINIFPDGKYEQLPSTDGNTFPYMVNVPTFKGKKIGLKFITQTTDMMVEDKTQKITIVEVHLCLEPGKAEYNPWFKRIYEPMKESHDVSVTVPMTTKFDVMEYREIRPTIIRNI